MATLPEYAQLSSRVYNRTQANRTYIPDGWQELTWRADDAITGYSAGAYRNGSELVISFTGSNEKLVADFALANIPAGIGLSSAQITQAATFVLDILAANPDATSISFTGHSLGGGLASVMAVFFDKQATIFDPAPFQLTAVNPLVLLTLQGYLSANGYNNAAFNNYVGSLGTLFSQREANVTSYYLQGEVLEPLRSVVPVIAGTETPVSAGAPSILDTGWPTKLAAARTTLHSMTLLNDMLLSTQFASAVRTQTYAIEVFTDQSLYATDPQTSFDPDFLNRMLRQHVGDPANGTSGNGMLDALGADMLRISQPSEIIRGVLATLTEYYQYLPDTSQTPFIEEVINGIRFDLTRIAAESDGRGQQRLRQQLQDWLRSKGERWMPLNDASRVTLQQGFGLNADMTGDNKNDLAIGGTDNDQIHGGGGDDSLLGGLGNDTLNGGAGRDTYIIQGNDTVLDSDGLGTLKDTNGRTIGGILQQQTDGSYTLASDLTISVTVGANLTLTWINGTQVTIENFQTGNLGLHIAPFIANDLQTTNTIEGDQAPLLNENGGVLQDEWGNIIPNGPEPDRADVLFAGGGYNDKIWSAVDSDNVCQKSLIRKVA